MTPTAPLRSDKTGTLTLNKMALLPDEGETPVFKDGVNQHEARMRRRCSRILPDGISSSWRIRIQHP